MKTIQLPSVSGTDFEILQHAMSVAIENATRNFEEALPLSSGHGREVENAVAARKQLCERLRGLRSKLQSAKPLEPWRVAKAAKAESRIE